MKTKVLLFTALFLSYFAMGAEHLDTSFVVNSNTHSLLYSIPDDYDSQKVYPLVIGLHYCGGTAAEFRTALQSVVDSLDIILACPDYASSRVPDSDTNMFKILVDSAQRMYSINLDEVYLTGMSCNSDFGLQQGLKKVYPFKGIFPWAPWAESSSSALYDYTSDMPTVISIGTSDVKYKTVLEIYDSLNAHQAHVDLILVPGVTHTLHFDELEDVMIRSVNYLNDTNSINIDAIDNVSMMSNETKEITFNVTNRTGKSMNVVAISSYSSTIPSPQVIETGNDTEYKLTLEPNDKSGEILMVVEASEVDGQGIEQVSFKVNLEKHTSFSTSATASSIKVYPNPTSGELHIENLIQNSSISIVDMSGRVVYSSLNSSSSQVITTNLKSGVYSLRIKSENSISVHRIIIE